jgi:hypothetical protein
MASGLVARPRRYGRPFWRVFLRRPSNANVPPVMTTVLPLMSALTVLTDLNLHCL